MECEGLDCIPMDVDQHLEDEKVLDVSGLWRQIRFAVDELLEESFTVRATVASFSLSRRGHVYLDLVQPLETGGTSKDVVAKMPSVIWSSQFESIRRNLDRHGLPQLSNDLEAIFIGRMILSERYGTFQFRIDAVDYRAMRVDEMVKVDEIRATLMSEGVFEANRTLRVAPVPLTIALVTSDAGVVKSDFALPLVRSGFRFAVETFATAVGGAFAVGELVAALERASSSECDLVVLVRGGGSASELSVFNQEAVVRAVVRSSKPIWCAIGHSTDQVLVNEVANRAFDVPQSVATAIVHRVEQFISELDDLLDSLVESSSRRLERETGGLLATIAGVSVRVAGLLRQQDRLIYGQLMRAGGASRASLQRGIEVYGSLSARAMSASSRLLEGERTALTAAETELRQTVTARVFSEARAVDVVATGLEAFDVEKVLRRGFAIVGDGRGLWIKGVAGMHSGFDATLRFSDGTADVRVVGEPDVKS